MAERVILRVWGRVVFGGAAMAYLAGAPDFAVVGAGPAARVTPSGLLDALPAKVAERARE